MKKNTKQAGCQNCKEKTYHTAGTALDDNLNRSPVWYCNLCNHQTPRKVQKRKTENSLLTASQLRAITQIQQYKLREGYEVKRFGVTQLGFNVSVVCEVGRKGDEGTLSAILCRYRGHFFVGTRGAIKAVDAKDENKDKAKKYPLIYGWRS